MNLWFKLLLCFLKLKNNPGKYYDPSNRCLGAHCHSPFIFFSIFTMAKWQKWRKNSPFSPSIFLPFSRFMPFCHRFSGNFFAIFAIIFSPLCHIIFSQKLMAKMVMSPQICFIVSPIKLKTKGTPLTFIIKM